MNAVSQAVGSVREAEGSLLDALLAAQEVDGYLTKQALAAVADAYRVPLTQLYETASFYSMLRFSPAGKTIIQICHNAPCHVAGASQTVEALEQALNLRMGETTSDGAVTLEYSECIGQCQASPSVLVNGNVHTNITADKVPQLLASLGRS